jgi:hypothetical protein
VALYNPSVLGVWKRLGSVAMKRSYHPATWHAVEIRFVTEPPVTCHRQNSVSSHYYIVQRLKIVRQSVFIVAEPNNDSFLDLVYRGLP